MSSPAERKPELEKYDIFEEIGHGGMATVYRAHDRRLGRDVAVKIIHRHLRENREVTARFASEARAVARVKHPNVVEVYDVSDDGEAERYLVVEFVPGTTLRKLLATHGHMPAEVAAALGLQIAAGLEHAHQQGVIHRDVKPENVLIAPASPSSGPRSADAARDHRALVKLTDFGIAKLLDAQGVTSTGQVLGSPAHMSPEQIEGGEVTPRSDVFGLGVLLYECMVGKLPFDGKNPAQVLRRVLDGAFTIPERARPTVGAEWSRILSTALAHDPMERYASCNEFAEAMRGELLRLGFSDPQREFADYVGDPDGYQSGYEARIVRELAMLGRRARTDRKIALAASCYNRALAFRPDDTELLAQVAGLAKRERLRRNAARIGAITAVSALLGAGAFGVTRFYRSSTHAPRETDTTAPAGSELPSRIRPELRRPAKPSAPAPKASAAVRPARPRVAAAPTVIPPPQSGTRLVRVVITGAKGGTLKVDGVKRDWFGPALTLDVGTHTFEFLPPNADCCVAPPPLVQEVPPGEKELVVVGEIPFRDAVLRFEAPVGYRASCGMLGTFSTSGEQRPVRMDAPTLPVKCSIEPPASSGQPPKVIDVTLHPGRTSTISW